MHLRFPSVIPFQLRPAINRWSFDRKTTRFRTNQESRLFLTPPVGGTNRLKSKFPCSNSRASCSVAKLRNCSVNCEKVKREGVFRKSLFYLKITDDFLDPPLNRVTSSKTGHELSAYLCNTLNKTCPGDVTTANETCKP